MTYDPKPPWLRDVDSEFVLGGRRFTCKAGVFCGAEDATYSTTLAAKYLLRVGNRTGQMLPPLDELTLPDLRGRRVFDVGCGCGPHTIFAALCGAQAWALDADPRSVQNTQLNADVHGVGVHAVVSDLFDGLPPGLTADEIIMNVPFLPDHWLGKMGTGDPRDTYSRLFAQVEERLADSQSVCWLLHASFGWTEIPGLVEASGMLRSRTDEEMFGFVWTMFQLGKRA